MLFYRAALPLSSRTLTYVAGIIRRHLAAIGSRWRKLNPGKQALLILVYLRKGETFAEIAAGFEVGGGYAYVVVDGTLIAIDRVAADRPFYSGKHRGHEMNLQFIANPSGGILWVSGALPGSAHDKKAAAESELDVLCVSVPLQMVLSVRSKSAFGVARVRRASSRSVIGARGGPRCW